MNLQRQLQNIADARRRELLPFIFQRTNGRVQSGPFKGMIIIPEVSWGDGDTASKLLGEYESELHFFIEQVVLSKPDTVINIGCAEGYYFVGMGIRLPNVKLHAVDISPAAIKVTSENAFANAVTNNETHCGEINHAWLQDKCELPNNPFLIVDCEGFELELLDPVKIPSLTKSTMLVECHDCVIPGITDALTKRFELTHDIKAVCQTTKDPYKFDFLNELSDCDKWALVHEGRPSTMTWLCMTPKL